MHFNSLTPVKGDNQEVRNNKIVKDGPSFEEFTDAYCEGGKAPFTVTKKQRRDLFMGPI